MIRGGAAMRRRPRTRAIVAWLLLWRARLSASQVGLVVCYHKVGDPGGDPALELVPSVGIKVFRRQLRHLARTYNVVPLAQLSSAAGRRRRGSRFPLALTFDDDLACHAEVAVSELRARSLPACFFLPGASLAEPYCFWWEDLQRIADRGGEFDLPPGSGIRRGDDIHRKAAQIELLDPDLRDAIALELHRVAGPWPDTSGIRAGAVRAIAGAGFEIGFHTRGHYVLTTLPDSRLDAELRAGRDELTALTAQPVERLAYPHGKADERVAKAVRRAGFTAAFTTEPTPVSPDADPYLLGRVDASPLSQAHLALDLARALTRPFPRKDT